MRRSVISVLAFLAVMVLGPAASAVGNYSLSGGGDVPSQPVLNRLTGATAGDVYFTVEGSVTVTRECSKELPKRVMEKTFVTEITMDETVGVTLQTSGGPNPQVVGFNLAPVALDGEIPTACPGGFETESVDTVSDIDLLAWYGMTYFVAIDGDVQL